MSEQLQQKDKEVSELNDLVTGKDEQLKAEKETLAGHHNPSKRKASSRRLGFGNNDRTGADLACKPSKSHTNLPQGPGSLGKEGFKAFSHYFKQTALQIMKRVTSALAFGIRRDTGPPSCHRGPSRAAWLSLTTEPDHQGTGPATWLTRHLSGAGLASTSPAT